MSPLTALYIVGCIAIFTLDILYILLSALLPILLTFSEVQS